jgi:hypothetical protein
VSFLERLTLVSLRIFLPLSIPTSASRCCQSDRYDPCLTHIPYLANIPILGSRKLAQGGQGAVPATVLRRHPSTSALLDASQIGPTCRGLPHVGFLLTTQCPPLDPQRGSPGIEQPARSNGPKRSVPVLHKTRCRSARVQIGGSMGSTRRRIRIRRVEGDVGCRGSVTSARTGQDSCAAGSLRTQCNDPQNKPVV